MIVEFSTASYTGLGFAVGNSYSTATNAQKVQDPEGQRIKVPYPQMLFITLFNTGSQGQIILTYSYNDNDSSNADSL